MLGIARPLPVHYADYVPHDVLPYQPRPGSVVEGRSEFDEFDVELRHNSFGFRGGEPAVPKPPDVLRIVGLGDSFTYGIGAPEDSVYLSLLGERVDRPGQRVDVINLGIPRYFTEAQRLVLELYGGQLQPDVVTLGFVPNDIVDTRLGLDGVGVSPDGWLVSADGAEALSELGPGLMWLYRNSHTFRVFFVAWMDRQSDEPHIEWGDVFKENGSLEGDWREVEDQLDRIAELVDGLGAEFVVVHIPLSGPWGPEASYPADRLRKWARRSDAHFVDALPALAEHDDMNDLYWARDGHATPLGNDIIASVMADFLVESGLTESAEPPAP